MTGTSQATPFVSAALAVLRGRYPGYTLPQIVAALTSTGVLVSAFGQSMLGDVHCVPDFRAGPGKRRRELPGADPQIFATTTLTSLCAACLPDAAQVTDPRNSLVTPRLNLRAAVSISCTPKISPSSLRVPQSGGTFTLTVTPPTSDCTWTVAAPSAPWMRIVGPTSGTGPGTITVEVDPAVGEARGAGVLVGAEDGSSGWGVLISQAVAPAADADTRAPVMGRLQVQSAAGAVTLRWPPARDSQSGVSSYMVVYNAGSTPPRPRCTTGTPVTQQPQASGSSMQLSLTGLTAGQRLTFRVCPVDAAGNVGVGSMWRGTPL